MSAITVEPLTQEYLNETIEVIVDAFGEECRKDAEIDFPASISNLPRTLQTLIALDNNEVIGASQCVHANMTPNTFIIMWIGVAPKHQKKGVGSEIIKKSCQYIEDVLLKNKKGTILLVSDANPDFYEKQGFKKDHTIHSGAPIMLKIVGEN